MDNEFSQPSIPVDEFGQPLQPTSYIAPYQEQIQDNIIKYQLDTFDDFVVRLIHIWRGEIYDPNTKQWMETHIDKTMPDGTIVKVRRRMLSEEGIMEMQSFLVEGKSILLSNYDKRQLFMTLRTILNTMTRMVTIHHQRYGIEDTAMAEAVIDISWMHMQSVFLSAKDGEMRTYFQKQIRESHTFIQSPQQQQKKRFGFI